MVLGDIADALSGATVGTAGTVPVGDIVILAVPYPSAAAVVTEYGDALQGKVIIDITNPVIPDLTGLVTPEGSSGAKELAKVAPAGAQVVKAFNTLFSNVLADEHTADVFLAGDDAEAKTRVSEFIGNLVLRPLDVGPLSMARALDYAGPLELGLMKHSLHHTNFAIGVSVFGRVRQLLQKDCSIHVFVTRGTGHAGSYVIGELVGAGHEVVALAWSEASATAVSALGATVRRGDIENLDELKEAAADSDGVIHLAFRRDLLSTGGIDAVTAVEFAQVAAFGEALGAQESPWSRQAASARPGKAWAGLLRRTTPSFPAGRSNTARCVSVIPWREVSLGLPSRACGRRLPRRRRERVERRAHPRCRRPVPAGAGAESGGPGVARGPGRGHPFPHARGDHR
jgi:8-hydroxy-5-deazaflavin:NADPH oxidoreductase